MMVKSWGKERTIMKKIYISADIEGIWGTAIPRTHPKAVSQYEEYRTNMIREVNFGD